MDKTRMIARLIDTFLDPPPVQVRMLHLATGVGIARSRLEVRGTLSTITGAGAMTGAQTPDRS